MGPQPVSRCHCRATSQTWSAAEPLSSCTPACHWPAACYSSPAYCSAPACKLRVSRWKVNMGGLLASFGPRIEAEALRCLLATRSVHHAHAQSVGPICRDFIVTLGRLLRYTLLARHGRGSLPCSLPAWRQAGRGRCTPRRCGRWRAHTGWWGTRTGRMGSARSPQPVTRAVHAHIEGTCSGRAPQEMGTQQWLSDET